MERHQEKSSPKKLSNTDSWTGEMVTNTATKWYKRRNGKQNIRIGTWNVRTMLAAGKMREIAKEMMR